MRPTKRSERYLFYFRQSGFSLNRCMRAEGNDGTLGGVVSACAAPGRRLDRMRRRRRERFCRRRMRSR